MSTYPANLNQLPSIPYKEYSRWTDYVELLCLSNQDNEFSPRDLEPFIKQNTELAPIEDNPDEKTLTKEEKSYLSKWDKWEQRINDFFHILSYRCQDMANFYPFQLAKDHLLTLKPNLTDENYFYLYLLFASNLAYFHQHQDIFTKTFEDVSKHTIKKLLPVNAEVHIFGTSRTDQRYTGQLYERICKLGDDIRADVTCKQGNFAGARAGDAGLDIVAWFPMDRASGIPVYFSQCACTSEWDRKQFSVSRDKWESRFRWVTPFLPITLIPFSFRKADGLWENDDLISKTLLIDRNRIILLLRDDVNFFCNTNAYQIITDLARKKVAM